MTVTRPDFLALQVRDPLPGVALHHALAAAGVPIVAPPVDGPFGRTFAFADLDGYAVTSHDRP